MKTLARNSGWPYDSLHNEDALKFKLRIQSRLERCAIINIPHLLTLRPLGRALRLALLLELSILVGPILGADFYVATVGTEGGSGTNWTTAYTNIQTALNAVANGDTVYLAGRTFALTEQLTWANIAQVTIRGGFAATTDDNLPGANDIRQWPTVMARIAGANSRALLISNVTDGVLDSVAITGGFQPDVSGGGGIRLVNCNGMVLSGCAITNNSIQGNNAYGGGIHSLNSAVTVSNCLVRGNFILCANGGEGGGIAITGGSMLLRDSIIANNWLSRNYVRMGGGLWINATCVLRNCLVLGNAPSGNLFGGYAKQGDGLYIAGGTTRLENCTVAYNTGQGIYRNNGSVSVTNSIIWGNGDDLVGTVAVGWSNVENGGNNGTNGCFRANPRFERGFYLAPDSPCIGQGTNSASDWGLDTYTTQVGGAPDSGPRVDLGYHYRTGYDFSCGDYYVASNGNNGNTGTNWGEAYRTITKALSMARDGTWVHVGSGNYTNGLETFPLTVNHLMGVQVLGTNRQTTVLNAAGSNKRAISINCNNVTLAELTITGGFGDIDGGGAILLRNCGGATVTGCVITNNTIQGNNAHGGGIHSQSSMATVSDCWIKNNRIICANGGEGGGIAISSSGAMLLRDSIIANNRLSGGSVQQGGGVWSDTACVIRNCLVRGNSMQPAVGLSDGLYLAPAGMSISVENCTVVNHTNQGIYASGAVAVTNSIIWNNGDDLNGAVTIGWSNIGDGDSIGVNGCMSADPLFVDATAADYHLSKNSPCVDAGINLEWMVAAGDLDGGKRINNGIADMGAYEAPSTVAGIVIEIQ